MCFPRLLRLRQQTCQLDDLSAAWQLAFCETFSAHGMDAARCYCLGA